MVACRSRHGPAGNARHRSHRGRSGARRDRRSLSLSKSARADGVLGPRTLRKLDWGQGQPRRYYKGRQWSSPTHTGRSSLDLSTSCTCRSGEAAEGGGRAEAGAGDRVESPNATVRAFPITLAQGQEASRRRHGDCPRARSLCLGDQSRGQPTSNGVTPPGAVDRSSREALDRAHRPSVAVSIKKNKSQTSIV